MESLKLPKPLRNLIDKAARGGCSGRLKFPTVEEMGKVVMATIDSKLHKPQFIDFRLKAEEFAFFLIASYVCKAMV